MRRASEVMGGGRTGARVRDNSWRSHLWSSLKIGMPLVGSQMVFLLAGLADSIMLGQVGVSELAASGFGSFYFFFFFIIGTGFSQAVLGRASAALGRNDKLAFRRSFRMGFWLVLFHGCLFSSFLWFCEPIFRIMGQDEAVIPLAASYTQILCLMFLPALWANLFQQAFSAFEKTRTIFWISVFTTALNILLNYVLIFGNWGAPALGIDGAAFATSFSAIAGLSVYVALTFRAPLRRFHLLARLWRWHMDTLVLLFRRGLPICLTFMCEISMFNGAGIMVGWLGEVSLAAHVIVIKITSLVFMFPLGFSFAATVRIAQADSQKDAFAMRRASIILVAIVVGFQLFMALVFVLIPDPMIRPFLNADDPDYEAIVMISRDLLFVAAIFLVADGLQALELGLLRGLGDTRFPMIVAAIGYLAIGMPLGYFMVTRTSFGAVGMWSALAVGLAFVAVVLAVRFASRERLGLVGYAVGDPAS